MSVVLGIAICMSLFFSPPDSSCACCSCEWIHSTPAQSVHRASSGSLSHLHDRSVLNGAKTVRTLQTGCSLCSSIVTHFAGALHVCSGLSDKGDPKLATESVMVPP